MIIRALIALFGLIWGSFLNVVACRLIENKSIIFPRSHCPSCKQHLAWYDLIPIVSWLALKGSCRSCSQPISSLYPFIELLTAALFVLLYTHVPTDYMIAYGVLFSALIVSIRTDLEHMLISRFMSVCMIPVGITLSIAGFLPITLQESFMGAFFGYAILWSIAQLFYAITHKQGMGEGDFELLAMIGSFTGVLGAWMSMSIGSFIGSILSIAYIKLSNKGPNTKIPFGPFLALGAIIFVLYNQMIFTLLFDQ